MCGCGVVMLIVFVWVVVCLFLVILCFLGGFVLVLVIWLFAYSFVCNVCEFGYLLVGFVGLVWLCLGVLVTYV